MCDCNPWYMGSASRSVDTMSHMGTNGQVHNGRDICRCGICKCTDPKCQEPTCEMWQTCLGVCAEHQECVLCRAFDKEEKDTCAQQCPHFNITNVESWANTLSRPGQSIPCLTVKRRMLRVAGFISHIQ